MYIIDNIYILHTRYIYAGYKCLVISSHIKPTWLVRSSNFCTQKLCLGCSDPLLLYCSRQSVTLEMLNQTFISLGELFPYSE